MRALRSLALPLLVALPPLFWVIDATNRASLTTLGRDQGIFQYVAWALKNGAVDYRDVRDVTGPLTHLVHLTFLALGGGDEHRFRSLDLLVTGLCFAFAGACLPGIATKRAPRIAERAGWAFAAWVILSGQYLMYLYWDLAQRESFFDWFMLSGVALQLVAQKSGRRGLLVVCGALSAIPWFGKPTYVLFTVVQAFALIVDRDMPLPRPRALLFFAAGCAAGASSQLAFLLACGDVRAFLRIYLVDVPAMYRFMLPRSAVEILSLSWGGTVAALSLLTSLAVIGLVLDRQMPRRAIGVALVPLAGIGSVLAQAKGFPYHFHPVTAGLHFAWLMLVVWLWERFRQRGIGYVRLVPWIAGAALSLKIAVALPDSPHVTDLWILAKAHDSEERASHDYLVYFRDKDFFPWEMHEAATYVREHTQPSDRVQTYGMDAYMLFLAQRLSATPYIYVYDLNPDAALGGSWMPDGLRPNATEAAKIKALRDAHEADLLARVKKDPPAAWVFFDKAPLTSEEDAFDDFSEHCPESAVWVKEHYRETAAFGEDHVWLRNDVASGVAAGDGGGEANPR